MDDVQLERLREQLQFLEGCVDAVLLFGAQARGEQTPRSDIDICLVAPGRKPAELLELAWSRLGGRYDLQVFETLPLHLKADVIRSHVPIWVKDAPALGEYFYFWRKLWADQERRHRISRDELARMLG